jgi:pilus assembly protein Flp/PilA
MLRPDPSSNSETPLSILSMAGRRAARDEHGGTAIEYALIAAGIGVAVAATVYSLGTTTAGLYQTLANMF